MNSNVFHVISQPVTSLYIWCHLTSTEFTHIDRILGCVHVGVMKQEWTSTCYTGIYLHTSICFRTERMTSRGIGIVLYNGIIIRMHVHYWITIVVDVITVHLRSSIAIAYCCTMLDFRSWHLIFLEACPLIDNSNCASSSSSTLNSACNMSLSIESSTENRKVRYNNIRHFEFQY